MKRSFVLALVLGCADPSLDAPGAACPCAQGYVCCVRSNVCVAPGDACGRGLALESITPAFGPIEGAEIELRGHGFQPDDEVRVGGARCERIGEARSDRITCVTPLGRLDQPIVEVAVGRGDDFVVVEGAYRYVLPSITNDPFAGLPMDAPKSLHPLVADLDGDGDFDLYGAHSEGIATEGVWFDNVGDFRFEDVTDPAMTSLLGGSTSTQVSADLDGDSVADLLVAGGNLSGARRVAFFRGVGGGAYEGAIVPTAFSDGAAPVALRVADLDADGYLDVVACMKHGVALDDIPVHLFRGGPNGPRQVTTTATTAGPRGEGESGGDSCALVDVDHDGQLEVVLAARVLRVFEIEGDRVVEDLVRGDDRTFPSVVYHIEPADLDGDGDLELVGGLRLSPGLRVWRLDPIGLRQAEPWRVEGLDLDPAQEVTLPVGSRNAVPIDVDRDGDLDLLLPLGRGPNEGILPRLLRSQIADGGEGFVLESIPFVGEPGGPTHAAYGDLDGDGDLDVFSASWRPRPNRWTLFRGGAADNVGAPGQPTNHHLSVRVLMDREAPTDFYGVLVELDLDGPPDAPDFAPGRRAKAVQPIQAPHAPRAFFGLGEREEPVWIRVRFPDGSEAVRRVDRFDTEVVVRDCPTPRCP